jgi:hypothetical protein
MRYIDITKEVHKKDRDLQDLIDYLTNIKRLYGPCSYRLYSQMKNDGWGDLPDSSFLIYPKKAGAT